MTKVTHSPTLRCAHCGDPCPDARIAEGDAHFCCQGCRTVHTLLAGELKLGELGGDYAWLEVGKLADRFVRFREGRRVRVELELPAIHCISCVWLLERMPKLLPGVMSCEVDYGRRRATIDYDGDRLGLRALAEWLDRSGYPPRLTAGEETEAGDPGLVKRIGVAGFCFGNVMLLSFPEYLGLGGDAAGSMFFAGRVGYLIIALAMPALLYAGRPFFGAAIAGLRSRRVTIELPVAIGMLAIFGRSLYEILSGVGAGYLDSLTGLVFFLLIGRWFQAHTFARLRFDRNYADYFPLAARRLNASGAQESVAAEDLAAGDRVLVRPGELVPADGRLLERPRAGVDYSFVTGEAEPRMLGAGEEVFAGGRALASALRMEITRPVDRSYLLGLWRRGNKKERSALLEPPARLVAGFTVGVTLIAILTFLYWYAYQGDPATAYRAATAVLIIACPCALALAAPFTYGTLQRLLARRGYYFRGPAAVLRLGEVDRIVFDKTGTLVGRAGDDRVVLLGAESELHLPIFRAMAAQSAHPVSQAFLTVSGAGKPVAIGNVEERVGEGLLHRSNGKDYRLGSAAFCGIDVGRDRLYGTVDGLPVLRLESSPRPARPGVEKLLERLSERVECYLLSGDVERDGGVWTDFIAPDRRHFSVSPYEKEHFVEAIQSDRHRVLMVGDGLNDSGALRTAHLGLAVSEGETDFSPASDGIVKADALEKLDEIITVARRGRYVLLVCLLLALAYNVVGLSYAVSGTLSPVIAAILMPLSSVSVVLVATLGAAIVADHRRH